MRKTIIITALVAAFCSIQAQERLSREEALKYAFYLSTDLKAMLNTPIPTDPDVKRPVAVREGEYGGLLLPESKLSAEAIAKAGKEVVPIGQLWMHKLAPLYEGQVVPVSKLRMVTVTTTEGQASMPLCALGVRKDASGNLELLVYGKEKEPVLKASMKAISSPQDNPIDMTGERKENGGLITLKILGKYEASFMVTDPEQY